MGCGGYGGYWRAHRTRTRTCTWGIYHPAAAKRLATRARRRLFEVRGVGWRGRLAQAGLGTASVFSHIQRSKLMQPGGARRIGKGQFWCREREWKVDAWKG